MVWANLRHHWVRTLIGVLGIMFAVILLFMQLGFLGSAEASATQIYDQLDFDLLLLSTDYVELSQSNNFLLQRLERVRSEPFVRRVVPVYINFMSWTDPRVRMPLAKRQLLLIGFPPDEHVFRLPDIVKAQARLKLPDTVLFDRQSGPSYGVREPIDTSPAAQVYRLGTRPIRIVGSFSLGAGFVANGLVLTSDQTFAQIQGGSSTLPFPQLGLIKLWPGGNPQLVADTLNRELGPGVHVWTRQGILQREKRYWVDSTSVGIIFYCGVWVAILVGIVFVCQVISSDINSRLREFATLKAIGYSDLSLGVTIVQQSLLLALLGYLPGLLVSFGLYALAVSMAGIPIGFPAEPLTVVLWRCLVVLLATLSFCAVSGLFALRTLTAADPADLF